MKFELKDDVKYMKRELLDFLNIMKHLIILLKDSLYFNIVYDEIMANQIDD